MLSNQDLIDYLKSKVTQEDSEIDDQTSLFSSGLLDSMSLVDLVAFIEEKTNVRLHYTDINLDNLDSVELILKLVDEVKKREG